MEEFCGGSFYCAKAERKCVEQMKLVEVSGSIQHDKEVAGGPSTGK